MSEDCGTLGDMANELQPAVTPRTAVGGEVIDPRGLAARAAEVAARQRSPETRRTYAAVYRSFAAFVGPQATAEDVTPEAVRAYRDALERCRALAGDGRQAPLGAARPGRRARRRPGDADGPLGARRARRAARARARRMGAAVADARPPHAARASATSRCLHLLGSAGLRRAEAAGLLVSDVDERRRASDPRLREAIARSTSWWVTVRYGKRGRTRAIPLDEDALAAIAAWVKARPAAASEHLLLSLPRTGQPPRALSTRDVARIVARYAEAAGLPEDRRTPHVLRHTFCTHLADAGADVGVIRELAGHADIRTTTVYTAVNDERLEDAIAERSRQRHGVRRAVARD